MKNILKIFISDVKRIRKNVIAMIVVIGVLVVPCLYAWFNIAASWDPYNNTGNLKVAVASVDEGYTGSLIPLEINVGEQVISALRENTQMDWVFTSKEKAMEGVKSGQYYAAIVVPEKFSTQMMSLFSDQIQKPEIIYYSNAKENAIAPKVTDKGATAIQKQIRQILKWGKAEVSHFVEYEGCKFKYRPDVVSAGIHHIKDGETVTPLPAASDTNIGGLL